MVMSMRKVLLKASMLTMHCLICLLILCALGAAAEKPASTYVLGPDDQLVVTVLELEEVHDAPLHIDLRGTVNVPLIGRLQAGGLTIDEVEAELNTRFRKYVKDPHITVAIKEFGSQPVSVLGSVNKPGIHQLRGRKNLFEVLSMAEGLRNDAGNSINITRRMAYGKLPLANAVVHPAGGFSVGEVAVSSVMHAKNPLENIAIMPEDVISVPRAAVVYVVGTVRKSGGFVLGEKTDVSALQAIALAEGLDRGAAANRARIFRKSADGSGSRIEIPVDLSKVLSGKGSDVPLYADDILFVPSSTAKKVSYRALETAVQLSTGVLIWR
jgi:polysaccharide export outer membrane protein